ncbi:hypothetical protein D9C73_023113 [Collichthys lucidus]|uniref:Uncharacterized protein n=1 Tax=Collichthys lucidus TaxID=240159 RepID=A0A4U5VJB6_COLLU|nr:hypothetical protein D9C73_023113 [Collichthys lucidus]
MVKKVRFVRSLTGFNRSNRHWQQGKHRSRPGAGVPVTGTVNAVIKDTLCRYVPHQIPARPHNQNKSTTRAFPAAITSRKPSPFPASKQKTRRKTSMTVAIRVFGAVDVLPVMRQAGEPLVSETTTVNGYRRRTLRTDTATTTTTTTTTTSLTRRQEPR